MFSRIDEWRNETNSVLSRQRHDSGYAENSIGADAKNR